MVRSHSLYPIELRGLQGHSTAENLVQRVYQFRHSGGGFECNAGSRPALRGDTDSANPKTSAGYLYGTQAVQRNGLCKTIIRRLPEQLATAILLKVMKNLIPEIAVLLMITVLPMSASPNSCTSKRIKVSNVCGIVLDSSGAPIRGATVQIETADGKWLSQAMWTKTDGQFSLPNVPQGESILAVTVTELQHNSWSLRRLLLQPVKITTTPKGGRCRKPLVVHMTGGVGCFGRVEKK